jgi:hypothetical protein
MNSVPKSQFRIIIVCVLLALFLVNYALLAWGFKPYLYCGFKDMVWSMYAPLQLLISLAGIIGLVVAVAMKRYGAAFFAALVTIFVYLGPEWMRILFTAGRGCT